MYVRRDANGIVVAVSETSDGEPGWEAVPSDDPTVGEFGRRLLERGNPLSPSDLDLVRVLEDLIELLVERSVIRFTDLPAPAQAKLLGRKSRRAELGRLSLLGDEGEPLI